VKKAPAAFSQMISILVGNWSLTGWNGDENHAANTLIESSEENTPIDSILRCVVVYLLVVGALKPSF